MTDSISEFDPYLYLAPSADHGGHADGHEWEWEWLAEKNGFGWCHISWETCEQTQAYFPLIQYLIPLYLSP